MNGCESERVEQKVSIVDCPYGKPTAEGQTVCVNGTLTDISASTNEATPAKWIWYNADGSVIANEETNTYHHSVSVEEAGTTMFSVSYLATEPQSGELCESQKAQVSTFHSFGLKIIRENCDELGYSKNFIIMDSDDTLTIIKKIFYGNCLIYQ